ncbi:MAG: ATP-dependent DNA helicase [Magnetococcales bacterium]|nr:ATP-dependent DNA helicase [Magnetococcales bacterium]MBF0114872.1 ATP-dependent DNA helicase [Magnetococcales bacterium]
MHTPEDWIHALFGAESLLARHIAAYEPRTVQTRMAQQVVQAVQSEQSLIVEAPTGTGKTLAYLLPLLAMGESLIVSTATKALQEQIFNKDIPLLRQVVGRPFSATLLKGRGNYLCRSRFNSFRHLGGAISPRERTWANKVIAWSDRTETGDREELLDLPDNLTFWPEISAGGDHCPGRRCAQYEACFLTVVRERARKSQLVVVNHHLFFADLALRDGGFGELLPDHGVVVFDEAHKIPDVVTQFFGWSLSNHQLRELAQDCSREAHEIGADDPALILALPDLEVAGQHLRDAFPTENRRDGLTPADMARDSLPGQALLQIEAALHHLLKVLEPHRERSVGLANCGRRTTELLETSGRIRSIEDPARIYWYETRERGIFLTASPLETGPTLRELLYPRVKSAIFTSATLATGSQGDGFSFLLDQLGLERQQTLCEQLPLVFDYRQQAILYLPEQIPEPDDPQFPAALITEIAALLQAARGRTLCLFTSQRMLERVRQGLHGRVPFTLLVQGEMAKGALLERFRKENSSVLLGLSSFWEGVDVPGDALSMVIIDRLPFVSPVDPLVAARSRWLEINRRNPFQEMFIPKAVLSLKQGVGRLLRRSSDRGGMAILDIRLTQKPYGRQLLSALPPARIVRHHRDVEHFFANT